MTSNSQAAVSAASAPVALLAIAQHIVDHKLLVPNTIAFEPGDPCVRLFLDNFGSERWMDSVHIDDERNVNIRPGWYRTEIDGRLPDMGVKVQLRFIREAPLKVVTA